MKLNFNSIIENFTVKTKSKTMMMGILLIATTFLIINITNGIAFARSASNTVVGCAHTAKITISHLPNQTSDASTEVTLSNIGPSDDQGQGSISIPGIGSGNVKAYFHIATVKEYGATVSDIPGQTEVSPATRLSEASVCNSGSIQSGFLYIPGIGSGSLAMTKVN
jgi:hypothetical protein